MRMRAPMMSIHTVAAGGGSILHFDGARFRVGPESAGADPGPACYRRGGPLTVTDANVMLGKLQPRSLSDGVRPRPDEPLDARRCARAFDALARARSATGGRAEEVADGFIAIANDNMADAIKKISVARGYDVTRYALNCFGGAGGQHACASPTRWAMRPCCPSAGGAAVGLRHGAGRHRTPSREQASNAARRRRAARVDGARRAGEARAGRSRQCRASPKTVNARTARAMRYAGDTPIEVHFAMPAAMRRAASKRRIAPASGSSTGTSAGHGGGRCRGGGGGGAFRRSGARRAGRSARAAARRAARASSRRGLARGRVYLREALDIGARSRARRSSSSRIRRSSSRRAGGRSHEPKTMSC